jgi:uncharacterized protein (DUF1330 family)
MAKAYAVVTYSSVSDPEKLAAYAKLAGQAVASVGARFLARGNAVVAREAIRCVEPLSGGRTTVAPV